MDRSEHRDIRIGTLAPMVAGAGYLKEVVRHGFESFQLTLWKEIGSLDLATAARQAQEALEGRAIISSVGIYGNPLTDDQTRTDWDRLIRQARSFGTDVVCGFAGALEDRSVDESIPRFAEVFGELARVAAGEGVRIAFENCDMGGTWEAPKWNIAHSPRAWNLMFDAVPGEVLGLEWEPCHQMVSLIEPLPQLREWAKRVYHVHGKDASIARDVLGREGLRSGARWVWHRTPGFGDTNWTDVISILRMSGYQGAIDIEGWHDPVFCDDLEMTGQVRALEYLRACRGGLYIANPEAGK